MKLRLILGDQLNAQHSWFKEVRDDVVYVMFEMRQETDYVRHHIQKVVAFFLAMRAFAEDRRNEGHKVVYWTLDDPKNKHDLPSNLKAVAQELQATSWAYQLPDEWRLDQQLGKLSEEWDLPCEVARHGALFDRARYPPKFLWVKGLSHGELLSHDAKEVRRPHGEW